jgi:hypothetical protein
MQRVAELLRQQRDQGKVTGENLSNLTRRLDSSRQGGGYLVNPQYSVPVGVEEVDLENFQFLGGRLKAAVGGWEVDTALPQLLVDIPANMAMPPLNSVVQVQYLGTYRNESGTVQEPRYVLTGSAGSYIMFLLTEVHDDFLACEHYPSGIEVYIFKPYSLQRTAYDGLTVNGISYTYAAAAERTASSGEVTETQLITPDYAVGEPIYAVPIDGGLSLLTGVNRPSDGQPLVWLDANVESRAWAAEEED